MVEEKAKYVLNENEEHVERVRKGIAKKEEKYGAGYCPCVTPLAHSEDTICPCLEYRTTGHCRCGLYKE